MLARHIAFPIIGYLLGSIPFGYLYGKKIRGIDIRKHGSGNVGATNAARVLGKHVFVIVFTADLLKGVLAVLLPYWLGMQESVQVLAGIAAIMGHTFSIFLKFRGGKGVATSAGVFAALAPISTAAAIVVFLVVLVIARYISLASISAAVALLAAGLVQFFSKNIGHWTFGAIVLVCVLVIWRHRSNIQRLKTGTEPRAGRK